MKKLFALLLITFLYSNIAFSQSILNRAKDVISPGIEFVKTSEETLFHDAFLLEFSIERVNKEYCMDVNLRRFYNDFKFTEEENSLVFILSNKETVTLKSSHIGRSTEWLRLNSGIWEFRTPFFMTKKDVAKLKEYDVTDVKIVYFGGTFEIEIEATKRDLIKRMLNLVE